jgi:biopolymer transport protein ExbB/TolQ
MLTQLFLQFALIGAEWVMWVLVAMSLLSGIIAVERGLFYMKRSVSIDGLRAKLSEHLEAREYKKAAELLKGDDSMEARVVLFALRSHERGPEAVEDLMSGALATEKNRYDKGLAVLGTIGNNAPFIGLFGTVLGIIGAFANLAEGSEEAARLVMAAISEALVATGVGLMVAIPAVILFNLFKSRQKKSIAQTELLGRTLLSFLRKGSEDGGV